MSKIYCRNCKYNKRKIKNSWTGHYISTLCKNPNNVKYIGDYYKPYKVIIREQFTLNAGNKCKYYQRKWWKIWLTELAIDEIIFFIIMGLYFGITTFALLLCLYNKNN